MVSRSTTELLRGRLALPTASALRGTWGEDQVCKLVACPVCQRKDLKKLPSGFPSLDVICRNCGAYMAQVKTHRVRPPRLTDRPNTIPGSGWRPLQTQIRVGQLRDMYVVGVEATTPEPTLQWIDLIPGNALYANSQIYVPHVLNRGTGYPMFNIDFRLLPQACRIGVYERP